MMITASFTLFFFLVSVKYEFEIFLVLKFLISWLLVSCRSVHLASVYWLVGTWLMVGGRLTGGFNETHCQVYQCTNCVFTTLKPRAEYFE